MFDASDAEFQSFPKVPVISQGIADIEVLPGMFYCQGMDGYSMGEFYEASATFASAVS